jgi:hypothetical protein
LTDYQVLTVLGKVGEGQGSPTFRQIGQTDGHIATGASTWLNGLEEFSVQKVVWMLVVVPVDTHGIRRVSFPGFKGGPSREVRERKHLSVDKGNSEQNANNCTERGHSKPF